MNRMIPLLFLLLPGPLLAQAAQDEVDLPGVERQIRGERSAANRELLARRLDGLRQAALDGEDQLRAGKLSSLAAMLSNPGGWRHPYESAAANRQIQVSTAAESCSAAVTVEAGETVQLHSQDAAGHAVTWLRFVAPEAGLYGISTIGSEGDPRLESWASCGQRPGELLDQVDDYYGLQAVLPLRAERAGQSFLVRLANPSFGQFQQISVLAGGYSISGNVSLGGASAVGINLRAFSVGGGFVGLGNAGADGNYTLNVFSNADVLVRTGADFGEGLNRVMQAHPSIPCYSAEAFTILGICVGPNPMTVFQASQAPHVDVDFDLPLGGRIGGIIYSESTGAPTDGAGATLSVTGVGVVRSINGDQSGRYRANGLPEGDYLLEGSAYGHVREIYDNVQCTVGPCDPSLGTEIPVSLGDSLQIDFALEDFRRLTVDVAGPAQSGMAITVVDQSGSFLGSYSGEYVSDQLTRFHINQQAGDFRFYLRGNAIVSQVYPDIPCAMQDCMQQLTSGALLNMPGTGTLDLMMTALPRPVISGQVRSDTTGSPMPNVFVSAFEVGATFATTSEFTDADGRFTLGGAYPGDYYLFAHSSTHIDEIYPDYVCQTFGSPPEQCAAGPVQSLGLENLDIEFVLDRGGVISGRVARDNGLPMYQTATVGVIDDATGSFVNTTYAYPSEGLYTLVDLLPQSMRVGAYGDLSIFPSVHPDVVCEREINPGFPFVDCPGGTPIPIELAGTTEGVDLLYVSAATREIRVTRLDTRMPVAGAVVDFWNTSGIWLSAAVTNVHGLVEVQYNLSPEVLLSTTNGAGLVDEVYNNLSCPDGSAYFGLCSLAGGTPVNTRPESPMDGPVQIVLSPEGSELLWVDGFED